jgi:hypothetical protein
MAETYRGRRIKFDNIAVGSATGVERTIAGGGGERTTLYGGKKEGFYQPGGTSFTSARQIEHFIAGTTDQTNG